MKIMPALVALVLLGWAGSAVAARVTFLCGADLCRVDADGGHRQRLTRDGRTHPYESVLNVRDSRFVAFRRRGGGCNGIIRADAALRHRRCAKIAQGISTDGTHVFSPTIDSQHSGLDYAPFPGRLEQQKQTFGSDIYGFAWGRGQQRFRAQDPESGAPFVCRLAADFTCGKTVATGGTRESLGTPDVSPDGRRLVTDVHEDDTGGLVLFDTGSGRRIRALTSDPADHVASFSPDNRSLVFERGYCDDTSSATACGPVDVFTIGVDGHGLRRVATHAGFPAWTR